ncbi:MAG TPA: TolC family protein [Kiritimatiellia bacterium]|nr:TolC family protein [Kiritimatiellia bacterium]
MKRRATILMLAGFLLATANAGAGWWSAYGHAGLDAAVEQGLAGNPDVVAVLARIRAADAALAAARSGRRPEAMVEAGYRTGREQSMRSGGVADDIDPLMAGTRLSWELDVFGRVGAEVGAARARLAGRGAEADAVRLMLVRDIVEAYITCAVLAEEQAWWTRQVGDIRALRERAARRVEAGLDDPPSLRQAVAMHEEVEHHAMEGDIQLDQARARLRSLLGGEDPAIAPTSLGGFTLPSLPELSGANLHVRRPDVVRAHADWQAARGEATQASRDRLPSLALVVSAAGEGASASSPDEWSAWAGPVVSLPLWQPRLRANAAGAMAGVSAAEAEWTAVALRAVLEIDNAWAERRRAAEMIGHMAARRDALRAEEESLARRREAGLIEETDWREGRAAHAEAARAHAVWLANGLRQHAALIAALGGITPP